MAGHSKWANIQHRKKAQDNRRGKIFSRLVREIQVAARRSGGDPAANPGLRLALEKARAANLGKDIIERSIQRGTGAANGADYEEVRYEGYGPGGVAIMVDCLTDNRNRSVAAVRSTFAKHGGNLGGNGSVSYLFRTVASLRYPADCDTDALLDASIEVDAIDFDPDVDGFSEITAEPQDCFHIKEKLEGCGFKADEVVIEERADEVPVPDDQAPKLMKLLQALDDLEDVQNLHTNASFQEGDSADVS